MQNHQISHVSLDFWGTVAIANPDYAKRRKEILSKYSKTILSSGEPHVHTPDYCHTAYTTVKKLIDNNTRRGTHYSTDECFTILADWLEMDNPFHYIMTLMKGELWEAFHENPPTILPEIVEQLKRLKDKNITISIGSNTNFIPGHVIRDAVLDKLNVFDFFVFSDELGYSKPNSDFFSIIYHKAYSMDGRYDVLKQNVVHIGDSLDFDHRGASEYGFNALHIQNPSELPSNLVIF